MTIKQVGQATVEYVFILAFAVSLAAKLAGPQGTLTNFFRSQMGSIGHVLSQNLIVGVCAKDCFYSGYKNGYTGQ